MKKWIVIIGSLLLVPICLVLMTSTIFVSQSSAAEEDCSSVQNETPNSDTDAGSESEAKAIFDHLTKSIGFSGAGASGALAVAQRESNFKVQAINPSGGVAGWFQWSGWGNTVNGDRIHSEGSIKGQDLSTLTQANEFKLLDYELKGSYNAVRTLVGKSKDPQQAALDWSEKFEGVSISDSQTKANEIKANALSWYTKFNGASIPDSIKDATNDGADSDTDDNYQEANSGCETGSGTGDQVEGTIPMGTYYDKLNPAAKKAIGKRPDFKSYPDDMTSAPWGHQCAWYVTYRAKEMGFNESNSTEGNGAVWGQSDPNFISEVGKPVAHSAVDFKQGQGGRGTSEAGHTAFVEYVNPDGSLIISECNVVSGHSGMDRASATQPEESYATISAADAKILTYVYPKGKG
ncbi:phage tail tip lysozyme [Lactococcus lactis]|uniref:Phage tail tip lysozyme n=1 Tax=Lactococcus lactis TaxID=1358 RepID=A0A9X4NJJ1_9LACT|nr:phage tail tip lysozyme [Lactococcus lactis]MDG4984579.1 phage tail tip lysozyme [Lactococcus lactis]